MAQRVLGLTYTSDSFPAQLVTVVPSNGDFHLILANHYLSPEIRSELNAIGLTGSAGNRRIFPTCETALTCCQ